MILKIAGKNAKTGRLIAEEIKGITYVTMGTSETGKPVLQYGRGNFVHCQEIEGILWEVCEEEVKTAKPAKPEKESVLSRKSKAEENLEANIRSMNERLKQNASNAEDPDDRDREKTDDIGMEMQV